ncbi:NUDIX hydrolase [Plantactinospora solaniradicis]|uniref:NUDIX hydrolase n=1 Tax=Plantactinospora solaniradicis TaxID=1723736 RepID=A0ABW1KHN0_9ACTN
MTLVPDHGTYRRRAARVLLLDAAGRVLLLRCLVDPEDPGAGHCWMVPGGGVDDGESLAQAAARELHEEVGLLVDPDELGEPVAQTTGYADLGWAEGLFRDDFFCHRVDTHVVDTSAMEPLERGSHSGHRWWPVEELASTDETVYPYELAPLLADLLAGGHQGQPVTLPWHH